MFKVNNKNSKMTAMTYFFSCSSVSIVNFEEVNAGWVHPNFPPTQSGNLDFPGFLIVFLYIVLSVQIWIPSIYWSTITGILYT